MRQLVSVVNDDGIGYFVSDGDGATQIAHVINPGLDVQDVIRLGVNLSDALRMTTLHLNGHTAHAVEAQEPPALPAATQTQPKRLKAHEPVVCRVCKRTLARRTSYTDHLVQVHRWDRAKARIEKNRAPAADDPNAVEYEAPRGPKGRRIADIRIAVADTWPNCEPSDVYAFIVKHPEGVSTRDIALALADDTKRGRQTIGNRLQTLYGQRLITKSDEMRPHFKTGTPTSTMVVRAREQAK